MNEPPTSRFGVPARALRDGNEIPLLGLGVWQVPNGPECVDVVRWTLDPAAELEDSLGRLGVDSVDLYIVHWPQGGPTWAWPGMEAARERGHARSIGVSNFSAGELEQLAAAAKDSPPVANQVQFSPFEYRRALLRDCEERGIVLEAYSPLGTGRHLADPMVGVIASDHGVSPAQVLLRWAVQRQIPVIPKSTNRARIEANGDIFDFELTDSEMATLDALDLTDGADGAREGAWW